MKAGRVRSSRIQTVMRPRRLRRGIGVILAATLLLLSAGAVLASFRQTEIVETVASESRSTVSFQRAAYLATREMALIQASLREPDGEERAAVDGASRQTLIALEALEVGGRERGELSVRLAERQRGLQPVFGRYLTLLDQGDEVAAQEVLEEQIEPVTTAILDELLAGQESQAKTYTNQLALAEQQSRLLQLGTLLSFLLGLAVLAVLGWSTRSHRLLVERMAATDSLTGLPNRAAFHARAEMALGRIRGSENRPTVLMLDLDGFKDVNDSLGHHIGDLLLVEVGNRLRGSVRTQDTVARLGGDEFAVLLTDADPGIGETVTERIAEALNTPFVIDGITLDIEASIGIATAEAGDDVATVVRYADTAMYAAKEHRLGHTRFDPERVNDTAARLTMLGDLRRALDAGEITLHYQPKISLDTGELIGAEALARWHHPTRGPVGPDEFIPVLEGTSLIHRFTSHVLDLALAQARVWLDAGHHIPVAVNVSTRCLLDTMLPDTVARALLNAGVPGNKLCIEITENTVMADPARAIEVLRRIRALGVRTAIDDFGTGYSSMSYLKILPVDEIKVDRSFVRDMATDRGNYVLVESAVDLGHNLGLAVVAEGVENAPTLAALRELGCDVAQGYHFARPLTPAAFDSYLAKGSGASVPPPASSEAALRAGPDRAGDDSAGSR
jgi:diguanylate cyclase (GGDEF)-like protein